jgi:hypothetical protein
MRMSVRLIVALVLVAVGNTGCSRGSSDPPPPASLAANSAKALAANSDTPSATGSQVVGSVPGNAGAHGVLCENAAEVWIAP